MKAGTELLFWWSFFGLLGSLWLVYEVYQWAARRERRKWLPEPTDRCVVGRDANAWIGRRT